jgi:hypothetical protein
MKATNENIDKLISEWHYSLSPMALHQWLGLTLEQFQYWVKHKTLPEIPLLRSKDLQVG